LVLAARGVSDLELSANHLDDVSANPGLGAVLSQVNAARTLDAQASGNNRLLDD
jgi:hypothetical protein